MKKNNKLLIALKHLETKIRQNIRIISEAFIVILVIITLVNVFLWSINNDNKEQKNEVQIEQEEPSIRQELAPTERGGELVQSGSRDAEETARVQELECLALNVYHESRSDNFAGRIAVADVVMNRVDSNLFPNTICEVVNQSVMRTNWKGNEVPVRGMCHFSWFCDGLSDEPMETDSYEDAQIVAEMALRGGWRGITEGATHYHATYVTPNWINDRGMVPVGRIGQHKFYRWH